MKDKTLPFVVSLLILSLSALAVAESMGTAFTYQGQLLDANVAADGSYDFKFQLYDMAVGGSQVGSDVTLAGEDVANGYFAVELDFGASAFGGDARWLQIAVSQELEDPSPYEPLDPRQELKPAPYAINADALDGQDASSFMTTADDHGRSGVASTLYENATALGDKYLGINDAAQNSHKVDGYHAGNNSGQVAVSNGTVCANLNADMLDGKHSASFVTSASDYGRSGVASTLFEGTTALASKYLGISATATDSDRVDGYDAGNASGQVALSNGIVCVNLNADRLDGQHASSFVTSTNDYGRSGAASTLFEGTTALASKYLGVSATATNSDRVDGSHAGNSSGQVALSNGTRCVNLNADRLDGYHASSFVMSGGDYGRSGVASTLYEGTTALTNKYLGKTATATNSDKVDNYHAGNASGQVALSNGALCTNLNADRLDGNHASAFATSSHWHNSLRAADGSPTNALYVDNNGNVGINTTSPSAFLEIDGDNGHDAVLRLSAYWNPELYFDAGGTTADSKIHFREVVGASATEVASIVFDGSDHDLNFGRPGLNILTIETSPGEVGILTTSPSRALDVNGKVRIRDIFTDVIAGYDLKVESDGDLVRVTSSERYKKNIEDLEIDPEQVLDLRPVAFNWKRSGDRDFGLIAEEVEEVIPELVVHDPQGRPDSVHYDKIAVYLLKVIKNQQEQIEVLEERLDALETSSNQGR